MVLQQLDRGQCFQQLLKLVFASTIDFGEFSI